MVGGKQLKNNKITIIILCISLVINVSLIFINVSKTKKISTMQNDIDKTLKYCLSSAYSDFSIDFRKDDSFYKRAFANINAAALLSELSTYEKKNDLLDVSLDNLYHLMLNASYKDIIDDNQKNFHDYLLKIQLNPGDIKSTKALLDYMDKMRIEK